jgi:hypothetical protein
MMAMTVLIGVSNEKVHETKIVERFLCWQEEKLGLTNQPPSFPNSPFSSIQYLHLVTLASFIDLLQFFTLCFLSSRLFMLYTRVSTQSLIFSFLI